MAQILDPRLDISLRARRGVVLTVTCRVVFSHIEDCMMRMCDDPEGVWYYLESYCYAEDHPTNHSADRSLFFMQKLPFPGTDPDNVTIVYTYASGSWLNEDPGPAPPETLPAPPGQDEIYVRLKLWNMFSHTVVAEAETNVVTGIFY